MRVVRRIVGTSRWRDPDGSDQQQRKQNPHESPTHRATLATKLRTVRAFRAIRDLSAVSSVKSVAVVLRLVRTVNVDVDVLGLLLGEPGQRTTEGLDVDLGHLLVEMLGQPVDLVV